MRRTNVLSCSFPTIVLVHGALTDASVWNEVTQRLQAAGATVAAPALPMRSLAEDAAYLAGFLRNRAGRDIVLVGHSYGGAVISHPQVVAETGRIAALVYVAAFQPDAGESAGELNERFPGSLLGPDTLTVVPRSGGGDELSLRPERFAEVYAADVDPAHAAVMAAGQRPIDPAALGEKLPGAPAWRGIPSWALVSTLDKSLPPQTLRFMTDRAGSHVVEVESSHAVPVSHPDVVAELILDAAHAVAEASGSSTDSPTCPAA